MSSHSRTRVPARRCRITRGGVHNAGVQNAACCVLCRADFVPPVEVVVGLAYTAAAIGDAGGGAGAWQLTTDLVYHDTFGLMTWSASSLLVRPPPPLLLQQIVPTIVI